MKNNDDELENLSEMDYREWMIKETFQFISSRGWANQKDGSFNWQTFLRILRNKRNNYNCG